MQFSVFYEAAIKLIINIVFSRNEKSDNLVVMSLKDMMNLNAFFFLFFVKL